MNQVLHIFRKDTRRFWAEILLSFFVLAIYAVRYPIHWQMQPAFTPRNYLAVVRDIDSLMIVLVPTAWWLLITRVVQAESLVGDRQWWVTRPYQRYSLFAAKALFLLVWLYIPFVAMEMKILSEAGLTPFGHASHWFLLLSVASGFVILPLLAIAATTTNFARMTMTLAGGLVAVELFHYVAAPYYPIYESTSTNSHSVYIVAVLVVGGAFIVAWQYLTGRLWLTRTFALCVAVLAVGVSFTVARMRESQIDREFPAPGAAAAAPIQVAFQPEKSNPLLAFPSERPGMMYVQLPLEFSGVAEGSVVEVEDIKFTIDSPDGQHWTSPWWTTQAMPQWTGMLNFLPGTYHPGVQIMMTRQQYERFQWFPFTLHLAFAVTELHPASETTAAFSTSDFLVNGYGVCASPAQWYLHHNLICRSEVGQSRLAHITTTWSKYPCSESQPEPQDLLSGSSWTGTAYPDRLSYIWNPVLANLVQPDVRRSDGRMGGTRELTLCPGTPMHFTQYAVADRTQVSLTIADFLLPKEPR